MKDKEHLPIYHFSAILYCLLLLGPFTYSQEPKVFSWSDFELKGKVKSTLVITDYGKESFEFNEQGLLTKGTTQYNGTDYDISYYKYVKGLIKEKRLEVYREDSLDRNTSIANIYRIDTVLNKVVAEKIYSYQNDFLEQYQYSYGAEGQLEKIRRMNNEGIDETIVVYDSIKGEQTRTYLLNGTLQRSVRTSIKKQKEGNWSSVILEKDYLNGEPSKALERELDTLGRVRKEQQFSYDRKKATFVMQAEMYFEYDEQGLLTKKTTKANNQVSKEEYIYQLDGHKPPNWIKKIMTPQNSYTTRKIVYYPETPANE